MKMVNNSYSIKRVIRLLCIDALWQWRGLAIGSLSALVGISLAAIIIQLNKSDGGSVVLGGMYPFILLSYALVFFAMMYGRLRTAEGFSYSTIPSTTGERMTHLIVLGVIYYLTACIILQMAFWVEITLRPEVLTNMGKIGKTILFPRSSVINPIAIFGLGGSTILILALAFYGIIRFRQPLYLVLLIVFIPMGVASIFRLWENPSIGIEVMNYISAVVMLMSYFTLKKLQ